MKRFQIISIPTDTWAYWFVYDRETRKSYECESMESARETAKLSNEVGYIV